jgi:hypothetical protein
MDHRWGREGKDVFDSRWNYFQSFRNWEIKIKISGRGHFLCFL